MRKNNFGQGKILVAGSLAYDQILHFHGRFQDEFLPTKLHALSVSFGVTEKASRLGGCAGNISRHLKKLGSEPLLTGFAGHDFEEYEKQLQKENIKTTHLLRILERRTATATVVTDDEDRQISFFLYGAQEHFAKQHEKFVKSMLKNENIAYAMLSPTNPDLIGFLAYYCEKHTIPYFFDPGQAVVDFSKDLLKNIVSKASGIFMNEYEESLLCKKMDISPKLLKTMCPLVVKTLGSKGSLVTFKEKTYRIDPVPVSFKKDPTGAGDAYRAGFLNEISKMKKPIGKLLGQDMKRAGDTGSKYASGFLSIPLR